ncbi:MAG: prepilin peptidase [Planctomycetota bacterium]
MLLIGTAACSAVLWAVRVATEPAALVMLVANLSIIGIAVSNRFAGLPRLTVLSLLVVGIVATFAVKEDPTHWRAPLTMFSPSMTLGALLVLAFRDGFLAMTNRTKAISPRKVVIVSIILAASTYMILIPSVDAFLETFRERPQSYKIEDLSPLEILRVRSAKLTVFAIFAYAGACVGSFLNVVAASAPRGEPIALRSSACPRCNTPIRRVDNLPILSFMRLRGRCRDCDAAIPARYFFVELVGLAIFASLFLYELITAAANVPGFQYYHATGILWIILYTKWPVIGVYFYHCLLFSCVLMLALMEQDRLRAPRWMTVILPTVFAGLAIALPTMLTVSLGDQTPLRLPSTFPGWLDRATSCVVGGILGWTIAFFARSLRLRRRQSSSSLALAFGILGISLGWQAVLTIAVLWIALMGILRMAGGRPLRPRWLTATTLLFVIAMLHHPAWKWLATQLSF